MNEKWSVGQLSEPYKIQRVDDYKNSSESYKFEVSDVMCGSNTLAILSNIRRIKGRAELNKGLILFSWCEAESMAVFNGCVSRNFYLHLSIVGNDI